MARQSRRLCDPGPCRGIDPVDRRLLLECGWPAAVRNGTAARRPRIPRLPGLLLIGAGPGEWRAAWVENDAAMELYVERGDTPPAGSIHLGRVVRRTPGLDAVLVDIGAERPGFLPVGSAAASRLDEGARVIVQVRRETQQGKGARLSTRIDPRRGRLDLEQLAVEAARYEPPRQLDPPSSLAHALALRLPAEPERILADDMAILLELRGAFPNAEIAHCPA